MHFPASTFTVLALCSAALVSTAPTSDDAAAVAMLKERDLNPSIVAVRADVVDDPVWGKNNCTVNASTLKNYWNDKTGWVNKIGMKRYRAAFSMEYRNGTRASDSTMKGLCDQWPISNKQGSTFSNVGASVVSCSSAWGPIHNFQCYHNEDPKINSWVVDGSQNNVPGALGIETCLTYYFVEGMKVVEGCGTAAKVD